MVLGTLLGNGEMQPKDDVGIGKVHLGMCRASDAGRGQHGRYGSLAGMAFNGWSASTLSNYYDQPVGFQTPNIVLASISRRAIRPNPNQDQSAVPRKPKLLGVAGAGYWRPAQDVLFPDLRQKCPKIPIK